MAPWLAEIGRARLVWYMVTLVSVSSPASRGEILCSYGAAGVAPSASHGYVSALVIFAKFAGEAPGEAHAPAWAQALFDVDRPGSFSHFYNEMSRGQLLVDGTVLPRRYSSLDRASAYTADTPGKLGDFGRFNLEVIAQADADADFGLYDNDGADGFPNSGDDDGVVDVVFINLLTVPRDFFIATATGYASLGFDNDYISNDPAAGGGLVRVAGRYSGFGGTTQRGHVFSVTAATMCHEFGHVLGLPDLFDQSAVNADGESEPDQDSAGIGKWGLMGLGTLGWGVEDGPNAFCAWSLAQLGWLGRNNENLILVDKSMRDVILDDVDQGGLVYKIPVSPDEYFLLSNRQARGSYYDRNIPGGGLLIWHVDERADNDEERHKKVDLVCADGLYNDRGFPGSIPDPISGRDNLDFYSADAAYAALHNGNQGDASDPFDGIRFTRFAYGENPGSSAYAGYRRGVPLGIAVQNIRNQDGVMVVDILLRQPVSGNVTTDTTWSGRIVVDGDIVVEPGVLLTLDSGTEVLFETGDSRATGFDTERSEFLVYGALDVEDTVSFASAATRPRRGDWLGLFLLAGQATTGKGIDIHHARFDGLVRNRLPPGITQLSERTRIPLDLLIPLDATLEVEAGTDLRFSSSDLSATGVSSELVELVVAGKLLLSGTSGRAISLGVATTARDDIWYGVRLVEGGEVVAAFVEVENCGYGFSGKLGAGDVFRLSDSRVRRAAGSGLRLLLNGLAEIDRTVFSRATGQGILVQGNGRLILRNVESIGNGGAGLVLGNCTLQATGLVLTDNGVINVENPRSGLIAWGGRGRSLEIWGGKVSGNAAFGLDLSDWEGRGELLQSEVVGNEQGGLRAGSIEHFVCKSDRISMNLGIGVVFAGGSVEVWDTIFEDNLRHGLVLTTGSRGIVDSSRFIDNDGLRLINAGDVTVRNSRFENASVGMATQSSKPRIVANEFVENITAVRISGDAVPSTIKGNVFVRTRLAAIENRAPIALNAAGNYWGTVDEAEISALVVGKVDWQPYLSEQPTTTGLTELRGLLPSVFELYAAYPNPFNANVGLAFDLPVPVPVKTVFYDILGRPVWRVKLGMLSAGRHLIFWDGRDSNGRPTASGVYTFRFKAGNWARMGRVVLVR